MLEAATNVTARDFQKNIGLYSDLVLSGQTLNVTKHGRPAYRVVPHSVPFAPTADSAERERRESGAALSRMLKEAQSTDAAKALSFDDVQMLIDTCFEPRPSA